MLDDMLFRAAADRRRVFIANGVELPRPLPRRPDSPNPRTPSALLAPVLAAALAGCAERIAPTGGGGRPLLTAQAVRLPDSLAYTGLPSDPANFPAKVNAEEVR